MAKDFKASQLRTSKIVISGSESGKPALLIYSASDATNFEGGFQSDMLTKVGSDVYLFVSGNNSSVLSGNRSRVTLFGGDVVVSGTFYAEKLVAEVDTTVNSDHHISGAIFLAEKAAAPSIGTDQVALYSLDDGGVSKLYFKNGAGVTELGGAGGGTITSGSFNEVANSNGSATTLVSSSSFSLAGELGMSHGVDQRGTDVFMFVSGTKSRVGYGLKENALFHSRSVFEGELVVSGNLHGEGSIVGYKDIILNKKDGIGNILGGIGRVSDVNSISIFNSNSLGGGGVPGTIKIQGRRESGGPATMFDYLSIQGEGGNFAKKADILPKEWNGTNDGTDGSEAYRPRITFLSGGAVSSPNEITAADVAVFFSGSSNSLDEATRGSTLFGGDVAASGTFKITRNAAHNNNVAFMINNAGTEVGDSGAIAQNFIAGFSGYTLGEGSSLVIKKSGPNNTFALGGPYANTIQGKSGSILIMAGGATTEYDGSQAIALTDVHQSNFLVATGSKQSGSSRVLILSGGAAGSADQQSGKDVGFFVSGSTGTKNSIVRGTSLFGGDVVISGTLYDGAGSVIGSGGGSITVVSGSTSLSSITQIDFEKAGVLNNNGGGVAALTGTIGNPEDGSYADGLFTTFTPQTTIGVAIDKINEVLKFLAPSPAPGLDNINADGAQGTNNTRLAFGASSGNNPAGYSIVPASMPTGNTLATVDINGQFLVATGSSPDLRLAVYNTATAVAGDLNADVAISDYNSGAIINHKADSFGDAEQGSLVLEVNGSDIVTVDLTQHTAGAGVPGSGTKTHYGTGDHTATGFIQLSQTGSARTQSDTEFPIFQHRTGKFTVSAATQRKGYNFAKVKHTVGSVTTSTNFVEWVYDTDGTNGSTPISANDAGIVAISLDGGTNKYELSGVKYAVTGSGEYRVRVENFYKHVYNTPSIESGINFTGVATATTLPASVAQLGGSEDHTKAIHVTSSFSTNFGPFLGTSVVGNITLAHPTKTGLSTAGSVTSGKFLIYSGAEDSTNASETFNGENFRMQSGSFSSQGDVNGGSYTWDSGKHMTSSNGGHSDGLMMYNGALRSPKNAVNTGDFRSSADGGSFFGTGFTYNSQPNYSGQSGVRTFYRKVQNTSGGAVTNFKIQFNQGTGDVPEIVTAGTTLDTTKMKVFARLPGETGSEWLDLGTQFTLGQTTNRVGGRANASLNTGGSPINFFTFGTGSAGNNDYFVIKIEADASLTREIGGITFTVPGNTGTYVEAPVLDSIDSDISGAAAKLSFGATVPLTGFTSVGTAGGQSAIDINGTFPVSGIRYGVIGSTTSITGTLNDDISSNSNNYPANAFTANPAHTQIRLNLNGVTHHTMDLRNAATTGEGKTGDSGFQNITAALNPTDGADLVPDYSKWYRTGNFAIGPANMVAGWNYAKVEIYNGSAWTATSFVEWVRDTDSSGLSISNTEFGAFAETNAQGVYYQSGVKYFQDPVGSFKSQASNAYSNVYSPDADGILITSVSNLGNASFIQVTGSSTALADASSRQIALPNLNTSLSEPTTGSLFVTGTVEFSQSTSLPGTSPFAGTSHAAAARIDVKHPLDGTQNSGTVYVGANSNKKFLVFSGSVGSTTEYTTERFGREDYRIVSGNYVLQTDVASGNWDSEQDMNNASNTDYYSGLIVYNGKLASPKDSRLPGSGDFRSFFDVGSSAVISPASNVNYSSLPVVSSSHRHYYRYFENNTVNNVFNVDVKIYGDGNLVGRSGALSGSLGSNDNVYVEGKIPGKTGWLDLGRATAGSGNIADGNGGLNGDSDQNIDSDGASNNLTFNGQTVNGTGTGAEKIVIKITAHKNWTGYITQIDVAY